MSRFIEVIGQSEYEQYPSKVLLDIDVSMRVAKQEHGRQEIKTVVHEILDHLFLSGLTKDEVFFGGREDFVPWWKNSKVGMEVKSRISIKSAQKSLVYDALERLDRYTGHKRIVVRISERQPMFEAKEGVEQQAMISACQNALEKAQVLAKACGTEVGKVLEIQELSRGVRGSGSYGDHDFGDYHGIALATGSRAGDSEYDDPATRIEGNRRVVYMKYRVKYQLC